MSPPVFHLVSATPLKEAAARAEIARGARPRHFLFELKDRLGGVLYEPGDETVRPRSREKFFLGLSPQLQAMAERIAGAAADADVIFCNGEGPGLALGAELSRAGKKTRLAVYAHNIDRPRMRLARRATRWFQRIDRLFLLSPSLIGAMKAALPAQADRIVRIDEQIDDRFFSPGDAAPHERPLLVSFGLEQRDYKTLAEAVDGLPADVRISAFSNDARQRKKGMPETLPANMSAAFYPWPELAQLYRNADIVVSPLLPNRYAAGITTILEGASAGKAIVATRTEGLDGVFADPGAVTWIPPLDATALRGAITSLIDDPARRADLGARARRAFIARHRKDDRVAWMADALQALAQEPR